MGVVHVPAHGIVASVCTADGQSMVTTTTCCRRSRHVHASMVEKRDTEGRWWWWAKVEPTKQGSGPPLNNHTGLSPSACIDTTFRRPSIPADHPGWAFCFLILGFLFPDFLGHSANCHLTLGKDGRSLEQATCYFGGRRGILGGVFLGSGSGAFGGEYFLILSTLPDLQGA